MRSLSCPSAETAPELAFEVGGLRVVVRPSRPGKLAHYLLFGQRSGARGSVLLGSGSEHETGACLRKALQAARRASLV